MDMALVVRRLTRPRATTTSQFMFVLKFFPFTGGGSNQAFREFIEIAIAVCDGHNAAAKREALELLLGLVRYRGMTPDGFPRLDTDDILYQLVLRVMEPRLIDQGSYGLCGPAAFVVLLAKMDPCRYVRVAMDLLLLGRAQIRGFQLRPNKDVRLHVPNRTPHADWLVLASVRSSDDVLSEGMNTGEYGGTTYGVMVEWLKMAGYGTVVGAFSAHLTGTIKKLSSLPLIKQLDAWACCQFHPQKPSFLNGIEATQITDQATNLFLADRFVKNHWKVFLLVSEKYTQTSGDQDPIEKALKPYRDLGVNVDGMRQNLIGQMVGGKTNHWILVKEIHLANDGTVRITRYSWGKKDTTAPISRELFYTIYGGFVAVTPLDVQGAVARWNW